NHTPSETGFYRVDVPSKHTGRRVTRYKNRVEIVDTLDDLFKFREVVDRFGLNYGAIDNRYISTLQGSREFVALTQYEDRSHPSPSLRAKLNISPAPRSIQIAASLWPRDAASSGTPVKDSRITF